MKKIGIIGIVIEVLGILLLLWNLLKATHIEIVGYVQPPLVGDFYIILSILLIIIGAVIIWFGFRKKK